MTGMIGDELFVDFSRRIVQARGSDSYTRPVEVDLRRAAYLSSSQDFEQEMQSISAALSGSWPKILLAFVNTPDGPPYRTAKVFLHQNLIQHKQIEDSGKIRLVSSSHYVAAGGGQAWDQDAEKGAVGFFVSGANDRTNVWRVFRVEMDAFGSSVVTLSPLVLSSGFPELTLPDTNEPLRSEILGHYEELQRHVLSHSYRALITSAKNIVEAIISPNDNFSTTLAKMGRSLLEAKEKKTKPPSPELAYHLAEKLRLLHQYTHVGGATRKGRSVSPELALTVVHDLIEILRELGYARK
ncbi:MAG: hypothetical protein HZB34_10445 [Nitrospirae bacterium]|nr:hypothetical protein [Nitrospirota bacterium]